MNCWLRGNLGVGAVIVNAASHEQPAVAGKAAEAGGRDAHVDAGGAGSGRSNGPKWATGSSGPRPGGQPGPRAQLDARLGWGQGESAGWHGQGQREGSARGTPSLGGLENAQSPSRGGGHGARAVDGQPRQTASETGAIF